MKYRYFSEYGKLLPLPEVLKPNDKDDWKYLHELADMWDVHNEWLSSGIHVPDEHLWYFEGVDRDESEFERQHQILLNGEWVNCSFFVWEKDLNDKRIVAIPKESKEQVDSPIEAVRDILNYIYAGGDSPYWMLKEVQMRLEKLITQ